MHDTVTPDYRQPECTVSELSTGRMLAQSGSLQEFNELEEYRLS